jgi:glyoxylase-like metal-dependent hydrolase (beta-lactamase superfamily II)
MVRDGKYSLVMTAVAAVLLVFHASASATRRAQGDVRTNGALTSVAVKPNIYMVAGAGGNVGLHIGNDGVILVDTGGAETADALLQLIRRLTDKPILYIINTSADSDHVGGNAAISAAGQPLVGPTAGPARREGIRGAQRAIVLAEVRVLERMSAPAGQQPPYPSAALPSSTYSASAGERQRNFVLNGDAIHVKHLPMAHTDGDSLVYFRRSDVLFTGDVFDPTRFPVIDLSRGGSVQGVIESLNAMVEMTFAAVPFPHREDGTVIVPGHGRVCGTTELIDYRDMVTIIRDRIQDLIDKGKTLEAIQQANPTAGYRRQYGAETGSWTTAMFVEAVYRSLMSQGGLR